MSKTIDEKVVQMRFDNQHFERNVQTSMSTLDKLKQKLNFKGAANGLDEVNNMAKNNKLGVLGDAANQVSMKFSALQVVGITALTNITNSAVNAGKRIISALTIDPVKTGFQEYETQLNAVQTILANTQSKGTTIDDVNAALDELNTYADKTIYNFTEMTRNIGTFTAAGVDLDTSVNAIQGIANLAAVSGSTSQQASTAMYQLSQALAAGTVKLMDWNSVVNAGMGGQVFQDALKETARVHGIAIDEMIEEQGSFRETLSEGWITTDILTETLEKFTATTEGLTEAEIEQAKAMWKARGYTDEQIEAIFKLGKTSTDAATKVKTLTQLWDVMKEAAQSGWAKTWQIIIGDFEEAKSLWTPVADVFTGFINKMSDARNAFLESALGMGFEKVQKTISKAFGPIEKVVEGTENLTASLEDLGKIADEVIIGKFGNGKERLDKLTEAGVNYYKVQNKVNEKLGDSTRHSDELIASQEKLLKGQVESTDKTEEATSETVKLTDAQKKQLKEMSKLSKAQMKAAGYTEEQIEAFEELRKVSEQLGIPMGELIDNLDQINGRWLLMNSFKNIGKSIADVFKSIGVAAKDVFGTLKPESLFNLIAGFHKLTEEMQVSKKTTENITNIFKGIFTVVDLLSRVLGGGVRIAFTLVSSVLKGFGVTALDAAGNLGELIYKFGEWVKKHDYIAKAVGWLAEKIPPVVENIKEFVKALYIDSGAAENFQKIANGVESVRNVLVGKFKAGLNSSIKIFESVLKLFGTNLGDLLAMISDYAVKVTDWIVANTFIVDGVGKIAEIIVRVIEGLGKLIKAFLGLEPVQKIIGKIADLFGKLFGSIDFEFKGTALESLYNWIDKTFIAMEKWVKTLDTQEWFQAGVDMVNGLLLGLESGIDNVIDVVADFANQIIDKFKSILGIHSPSTVMIAIGGYIILGLVHGLMSGEFTLFKAVGDLVSNVISMFGDLIQNGLPAIWDLIKEIGSQFAANIKNNGIDFGALFVVGTAIIALVILKKLYDVLKKLLEPIEGFADLMKSLSGVLNQFKDNLKAAKWRIYADAIKSVAIAIAILAGSLIALSMVDPKKLGIALAIMAGLVLELSALLFVASKVDPAAFGKLALMTLSLSVAMLILVKAVKNLAELKLEEALMGIAILATMFGLIGGMLYLIGKLDWRNLAYMEGAGTMMLKMSIAIGIMSVALRMIGGMSAEDAFQGMFIISAMMGLMIAFGKFGTIKIGNPLEIGKMFMQMAIAIGIMAVALKLIGTMSGEEITKGIIVFSGLTLMFYAMNKASILSSKTSPVAAKSFLAFAGAVGILAIAMKMLASLSGNDIAKGLIAIAGIELIFWMYSQVSVKAAKSKANAAKGFMWMAVGIGAAAIAIRLLAGMSMDDILKGMTVIAAMGGLFIFAGESLSKVGKNIDKAGIMFMKMSVAILILVGAIAVLAILQPDDVIRGTACISALILCFAALAGITKYAKVTKEAQKTMLIMAGIIGAFAGIIALLSLLDPEAVTTSTAALSTVMLAFSASMLIMGKAGRISTTVSKQIIPMLGIVAGLAAIIAMLSMIEPDYALPVAQALTLLLEAFAASLFILGATGRISKSVTTNVWSMLGVVAALAAIMGVLTALDVAPSIETATALSILLIALSASLAILGAIGLLGLPALATGVLGLLILIAAVGSVILALAGLNRLFDGSIENLLDEGIPLLEKIGNALGRFVGGIVGGVGEAITNSMPKMAENLSSFMEKLSPFIEGSKKIDGDTVSGIVNLTKAFLLLTGANFLDKITQFWTGESSMENFGEQLSAFGDAIVDFSEKMSGSKLNMEAINQSVKAGEALAGLAEVIPKTGGLKQLFSGENNLADFGSQLGSFGMAIAGYSAILTANPINVDLIKQSAKAGKALADMAEGIPDNGKLFNMFGTSNIEQFSTDIQWFGMAISSFSSTIVQNGGLNIDAITTAAKAGKALAKMASEIPDSGKLFSMFGESNLETFSKDLPLFGAAILGFSNALTTEGGIDVEAVTAAAKAGKALAKMASAVPDSGKLFNMFGESELETFSKDLKLFGAAMCSFSESVVDLDADAVVAAEPAIKSLTRVIKGMKDLDITGAQSFKTAVATLAGADIDGFIDTFKGKSADLTSVGKDMSKTLVAGIKENKTSVSDAGKSLVKSFKSGITKAEGIKKAGKDLGAKLKEGIKATEGMKKAGKNLADKAKDGAREKRDAFKKAGKYLGEGLVEGINAKKQAAYDAGFALGRKAAQGVKDGSDEESPSKLTYQYGVWQGEGLINGILAMGTKAYKAAYGFGNDTARAMSESVGKIASLIDSDMDLQPTIRPVLDLSDVEAGAGSIGGMFTSESLGVSANLGAIKSAINRKNQNGTNDDVIRAIDKLGKGLDNNRGDTYTINGVTYDDGSRIQAAFGEVIRQARIERRV